MSNSIAKLKCAVCGDQSMLDLVEEYPPFSIYHCRICDVIFSDPLKNPGRTWYEDDLETRVRLLLTSSRYPREMLREPHRYFFRDLPTVGGRLFDVGCSDGGFLAVASQWYDVTGIDFNYKAVDIARTRYGL